MIPATQANDPERARQMLAEFVRDREEREQAIALRFPDEYERPCAFCVHSDMPVEEVAAGVRWWCYGPEEPAWWTCANHFLKQENLRHLRTFRKDGWPLCPKCEEDEVYSVVMMCWKGDEPKPTMEECLQGELGCYRCGWVKMGVRS